MPNIIVNGSITLPPDLHWEDEFSWSPVGLKESVSLTGATILQASKRQDGRRITLKSGEDFAWLTRVQLVELKALEETVPNPTFQLVMGDGTAFTVKFASTEGRAIEADAVQPGKKPEPTDLFKATLRFMEVSDDN